MYFKRLIIWAQTGSQNAAIRSVNADSGSDNTAIVSQSNANFIEPSGLAVDQSSKKSLIPVFNLLHSSLL